MTEKDPLNTLHPTPNSAKLDNTNEEKGGKICRISLLNQKSWYTHQKNLQQRRALDENVGPSSKLQVSRILWAPINFILIFRLLLNLLFLVI